MKLKWLVTPAVLATAVNKGHWFLLQKMLFS
jgi:hypothetical protein